MKGIGCAVVAVLLAAACRSKDVEVYRLPKSETEADSSTAASPAAVEAASGNAGVRWTAPAGWQSKPASGMRMATFVLPAGSEEAELSVVVLEGNAGGALANVNRWRAQLGLEVLDEGRLKSSAKTVRSAAGDVLVVDFAAPDGKTGMLGAMLPKGGQTWFFKLAASASGVKTAKPSVLRFLEGLHP